MKQMSMDVYIHRKKSQQNDQNNQSKRQQRQINQNHYSSRENSDTQKMEIQKQDRIYLLQQQKICMSMILAGPSDSINWPSIHSKLQKLMSNYSKASALQLIAKNLLYQGIKNITILDELQSKVFFKQTLPYLIQQIIQKHDQISSCIKTLVSKNSMVSYISRQQAMLLLISMFLGIMPCNSVNGWTNFGQFMFKKDNDRYQLKAQKLLFIINYFNMVIKLKQEQLKQVITFQRATINVQQTEKTLDVEDYDRHQPMRQVKFQEGFIQDWYGKAAMVDFANQKIGGGVLKNGCVQQQILFLIFPQAIVSMLICNTMKTNQSIIMYGLRRFSKYQNYSYNLKYAGPYEQSHPSINSSIMIAIDAFDFSNKLGSQLQYHKHYILREIIKAMAGFQGIQYLAQGEPSICTGRWGCGAFKGDEVWKFFIQWIACSQVGRSMIYVADMNAALKYDLQKAVSKLIDKNTLDVLSIMESFANIKNSNKYPKDYSFIQYLKHHV